MYNDGGLQAFYEWNRFMNIALKHLISSLATLLLPAWLSGQCIGNVSWIGGTPAAGSLTANATILGTVGVQMRSAGSFAGARPTYSSITEPYSGFTYQTLLIARGASFATGTYTSYKLSTPLPPSLIHISVRDIRGDAFNAEHQRVEGYLNGVPVTANFEDPINGAFITGGNIINGAAGTTSLVQSAMRAFFTGPVDSIVVKATSWSDYVIVNLHVRCDILLPFNLLSLKGWSFEAGTELSWKVTGESKILAYQVEYSQDGIHWMAIGTVNVQGGNALEKSYQFRHGHMHSGRLFYRLYAIESSGPGKYSPVISVLPDQHTRNARLFPNPAQQTFAIRVDNPDDRETAIIRSADGSIRKVVALGSNENLISCSNWPRGIYLVTFVQAGKVTLSHKLILH
jgi:hypothetical protein